MEDYSPIVKSCIVVESSSGRELLRVLQEGMAQLGLIINHQGELVGVATDGDIRRGLLKGLSLDHAAKDFANQEFIFVLKTKAKSKIEAIEEARKASRLKQVKQVPILDLHNHPIDLFQDSIDPVDSSKKRLENLCILLAGGKGARLRPLTLNTPKPMLQIAGKPILEIAMEQCISVGIYKFIISVNYLKEQIIDYFGNGEKWGVSISYLEEDEPLGTAGPLSLLKEYPNKPLLVMNSDILTRLDLSSVFRFHKKNKAKATICVRSHQIQVPFGVVSTDGAVVQNIDEKPIHNYNVSAGIYLIEPDALDLMSKPIRIDMPDFLLQIKSNIGPVVAYPIHEYWLDIGRPETLAQASFEWTNEVIN